MTKVLVLVADGTEEMEAVVVIDTLRRAKWEVTVAGLKEGPITASRGLKLLPDAVLDKVQAGAFDILVVPGGGRGVENMAKEARVLETIRGFHKAGKMIAAICAGPLVLQAAGILDGRTVTSHPDVEARITKATRIDQDVVIDGHLVTSQGAGTSLKFALAIVSKVAGKKLADTVAKGMVA